MARPIMHQVKLHGDNQHTNKMRIKQIILSGVVG